LTLHYCELCNSLMDRIDAMQAFVAVADLQGFAPAARKLRLSPSAVTRLIAALEDRLGARLLQRTTRQVTLTDAGSRYLERARRVLADIEEAEDAIEGERTRPGYLKARGEPKRPQEISAHDTIQFGAMTAAPDWRFVEDGREIRVASTPRFATNSSDAAIQYAEADGGLTRVMAYQAAESLKAGRLRVVLAPFEQPAMPIHIVYPTSRLLSAKVRTFIDLVTEMADWHFG
jgi:DNA-binding transcriptional LysR family regulator